ncbi:MAG: GntR family transcriptional regulator [Anaerolineales bacterium]|jgi:GntR family transcriptional regulator
MNRATLQLLHDLEDSLWAHGQPLPSLDQMAERYRATTAEVEAAVRDLIYEGLLERDPSNREIVRRVKSPLWGTITGNHSLTKEAKRRGEEPGTEILTFETLPAWPAVAERLALALSDEVIIMERLRTASGIPVSLEFSYYPAKLYPGMTIEMFTGGGEGQSSFKIMQEKFGLVPDHAVDEVTVAAIEAREAKLLNIDPGTPVLIRFRLTITEDGRPIKGSRAIYLFKAGYTLPI